VIVVRWAGRSGYKPIIIRVDALQMVTLLPSVSSIPEELLQYDIFRDPRLLQFQQFIVVDVFRSHQVTPRETPHVEKLDKINQ